MTRAGTTVGTAALLALAAAGAAGAQQELEGPRFRADVLEVELSGRVQTQFATTTVDVEPGSQIFLRRVRLEAEVLINELVSGKIAPDFAGDRVSMKDAYLKLNFSPGVQFLAGKAHRPFGLLERTSSNLSLPVERGADIPGVAALDEYELVNGLRYSDRDVGLQLMGAPAAAPMGFTYAAGVFAGPLRGLQGVDDSYQVAARTTIRPAAELRLGAGVSNRGFVAPDGGLERGTAWELDVEYGAFDPGVHLLGEIVTGDYDPVTGDTFRGAQAWLGYRTERLNDAVSAVEPLMRVSVGDIDSDLSDRESLGGTLLTPGVNVWFGGLNRLQLNYDVWLPSADGADAAGSFKAQFQMAF